MEKRNTITTVINHEKLTIDSSKAFMPLGNFLREEQNLTGTKIVCAEGDCGACTVLLAKGVGVDGKLKFQSVNSCILPLYLVDGAHVVTVEGIGESEGVSVKLSEVQQKMVDCNGAQCGYCTPGFICAMAGAAETFKSEGKKLTEKNARNYLTGNLCRCTGYQPIIDAMTSVDLSKVELLKDRYHNPAWLLEMKTIQTSSVEMQASDRSLFLPSTLKEALFIKARDPHVRLIGGSTDVGVVVNKGKVETPKAMALYHIQELNKISHDQTHLTVGACVTLTDFEKYCESHFSEMANMLHIFASPQIKNQGTVVGNVVNASPIADTIPFLMVADAEVLIESDKGKRSVVLKNFYKGYKQLDLTSDEIVVGLRVPLLKKGESIKLYKASMRKDLDISAVTFAGFIRLEDGKILDLRIAYGGVAATVIRLPALEQSLVGQTFSEKLLADASAQLDQLIKPLSDLRASKEYRMLVAKNYLKKFAREVEAKL